MFPRGNDEGAMEGGAGLRLVRGVHTVDMLGMMLKEELGRSLAFDVYIYCNFSESRKTGWMKLTAPVRVLWQRSMGERRLCLTKKFICTVDRKRSRLDSKFTIGTNQTRNIMGKVH